MIPSLPYSLLNQIYISILSLEHSNNQQEPTNPNCKVIESYDNLLAVLHEIKGQTETEYTKTLEELTKGLVGWPGFEEVFTISALHGDGIDDLREYLLQNAKPSHGLWKYDQDLLTDKVTDFLGVIS